MSYCDPMNQQLAKHVAEKWRSGIVVHYCELTD